MASDICTFITTLASKVFFALQSLLISGKQRENDVVLLRGCYTLSFVNFLAFY